MVQPQREWEEARKRMNEQAKRLANILLNHVSLTMTGTELTYKYKSLKLTGDVYKRQVLNRCAARTIIARETAEALAEHDPPVLAARIGQRVVFADAAQSGRLVFDIDETSPAAREITALAEEIGSLVR